MEQVRITQSGGPWMRIADPEQAGWSVNKLEEARQWFEEIGSAAFMAIHQGAVVAAWGNIAYPYKAHSIRKSIVSALYGIHVHEGNIHPNQTLAELGIDDVPPLTEAEKQARIIHLLKARSGIYHEAASETEAMKKQRPPRGSHPPDTNWYYNNWDFNALETILEQQTGNSVFDEFDMRLAKPLGMEDFSRIHTWSYREEELSAHGAHHYRLSARDMARFGLLYLQKGQWGRERILPERWVTESATPYSVNEQLKAGYGYLWWIPLSGLWKQLGMYEAAGVGGQRITVLPAADMVLVHRADTDNNQPVAGPRIMKLCKLIYEAKIASPAERPKLTTLVP